nr:hypothetical protein [Candidatus Cloacimonas sp.]
KYNQGRRNNCRRFPQGDKMKPKKRKTKFTLVLHKGILPDANYILSELNGIIPEFDGILPQTKEINLLKKARCK